MKTNYLSSRIVTILILLILLILMMVNIRTNLYEYIITPSNTVLKINRLTYDVYKCGSTGYWLSRKNVNCIPYIKR